jgi:uncharacterized protein
MRALSNPELLRSGEITEIPVDLWSTSIIVARGHKLWAQVASNNYPSYELNSHTIKNAKSDESRPQIAQNLIHFDAVHISRVLLPAVRIIRVYRP